MRFAPHLPLILAACVAPALTVVAEVPPKSQASASPLRLLGLAHVAIRVDDLAKARHFYHDVGGFEEAYDAKAADGSIQAAYFKINDLQFIEIVPDLTPDEMVPMMSIAIRTDRLEQLRGKLADLGLDPGPIRPDPDGSRGFEVTRLPGQNLGCLEFVQYVPGCLADRSKGQFLGANRLSTHLEHAGIIATDFDTAFKFYTATLGFHEHWRRVTSDQSRVVIDHIDLPGASGDFVELSNQTGSPNPLVRQRAGMAAHFALQVPDVKPVVAAARSRDATLKFVPPHYGMDNRWNFNLYDPDHTRMEFMQAEDPAHPTPARAVTPAAR